MVSNQRAANAFYGVYLTLYFVYLVVIRNAVRWKPKHIFSYWRVSLHYRRGRGASRLLRGLPPESNAVQGRRIPERIAHELTGGASNRKLRNGQVGCHPAYQWVTRLNRTPCKKRKNPRTASALTCRRIKQSQIEESASQGAVPPTNGFPA